MSDLMTMCMRVRCSAASRIQKTQGTGNSRSALRTGRGTGAPLHCVSMHRHSSSDGIRDRVVLMAGEMHDVDVDVGTEGPASRVKCVYGRTFIQFHLPLSRHLRTRPCMNTSLLCSAVHGTLLRGDFAGATSQPQPQSFGRCNVPHVSTWMDEWLLGWIEGRGSSHVLAVFHSYVIAAIAIAMALWYCTILYTFVYTRTD